MGDGEIVLGFPFGTKYDSTALSNYTDIFPHPPPSKPPISLVKKLRPQQINIICLKKILVLVQPEFSRPWRVPNQYRQPYRMHL